MKREVGIAVALAYVSLVSAGPVTLAAVDSNPSAITKPTPAITNKEDHVKGTAGKVLGERRDGLVKEAIEAHDEMLHAVMSLNKNDTTNAIKMLEQADGKLTVVLARDPNLKLAPIDVRASVIDLDASPKAIEEDIKDAKQYLDKGQLQQARATLAPLTSEMRVDTDYLPLEIFPDSIKLASKQIQEGKTKEAATTLEDAMSTIVTLTDTIPLQPVKAQGDILQAESLIKEAKAVDKDKVLSLLKSADTHLADAKALGYGNYQDIRDQIDAIKSDIATGSTSPSLFHKVENMFDELVYGYAKH